MKKLALLLLLLVVSLGAVGAVPGKVAFAGEEALKAEAEKGLGEILDLWRDGRYDELYYRTLAGGKQTKEAFAERLSSAPYRPACCWEKLQEVRVIVKNDERVVIRAKIGLEGGGNTTFKTRDYKLEKEDGVWLIAQSDILFLAGLAKKKAAGKKKKAHSKSY